MKKKQFLKQYEQWTKKVIWLGFAREVMECNRLRDTWIKSDLKEDFDKLQEQIALVVMELRKAENVSS